MRNSHNGDPEADLRQLDRALRSIQVPRLEPADVGRIVGQGRSPAYPLPVWIPAAAAVTGLLLAGHLVGLDMRWGLLVTLKAGWILLEGLVQDGPYGLGGMAERALWLAGLVLAGCGLAGVIVATVVERVEPQGAGGRSR